MLFEYKWYFQNCISIINNKIIKSFISPFTSNLYTLSVEFNHLFLFSWTSHPSQKLFLQTIILEKLLRLFSGSTHFAHCNVNLDALVVGLFTAVIAIFLHLKLPPCNKDFCRQVDMGSIQCYHFQWLLSRIFLCSISQLCSFLSFQCCHLPLVFNTVKYYDLIFIRGKLKNRVHVK